MAKKKKTEKTNETAESAKPEPRDAPEMALNKRDAKKALERITAQLKRLKKDGDRSAWAIGRKLRHVEELGLHRANGHASIAAYSEEEVGLGKSQAFKYMRVSGLFSETSVSTLGVDQLDLGLRYIARTPEDEKPGDIPELVVRVPSGDGSVEQKPFVECSWSDLTRALSTLAAASEAAVPQKAQRALTRADQALDETVGEENAQRAEVALRSGRKGELLVDIRGIPYSLARKALATLAKSFPK